MLSTTDNGGSISERVEYARRLEKIESVKARERQGKRNDLTSEKNFSNVERTSDIVAEKIGIGSGKQYEKENTYSITPTLSRPKIMPKL